MFKLAHISISATDLAASERFYSDVLGLKKQFLFKKDGQAFGFYFALNDQTFIEIFTEAGAQSDPNPLIKHFALEVADMDAAIAHIRAKGWTISDKKMGGDNAWQAWLADPSGIQIELQQYTPPSSQFTGADCIVDW